MRYKRDFALLNQLIEEARRKVITRQDGFTADQPSAAAIIELRFRRHLRTDYNALACISQQK